MQIKIAVVQFEIEQFAPEKNLAKAERFMREAAAQQAEIVVFPEDFVTGPLHGRRDLADFDQRYAKHFQALAVKYNVDVVPGSIIEGDEGGLYNTSYYIDRLGEILGRYRKVNLWLTERAFIQAGSEVKVCATRFGKIGLAICWDLAFPEHFRALIAQGAEVVICPSYWCYEDAGRGRRHNPDSEVTFVNALCTARAFEQEIIVVFANAAGTLRGNDIEARLIGRSQVTAPFKGPLRRCDDNQEMMFVQTIDTGILAEAETAYEIRADLKRRLRPASNPPTKQAG
jgi:predicted amidohydrolase